MDTRIAKFKTINCVLCRPFLFMYLCTIYDVYSKEMLISWHQVHRLVVLTISLKYEHYLYRVIRNDCRGFNNLSYTIHLRQQYVVAPMDPEILEVVFHDVRCAVLMHFSAWSAVY